MDANANQAPPPTGKRSARYRSPHPEGSSYGITRQQVIYLRRPIRRTVGFDTRGRTQGHHVGNWIIHKPVISLAWEIKRSQMMRYPLFVIERNAIPNNSPTNECNADNCEANERMETFRLLMYMLTMFRAVVTILIGNNTN